MTTVGYGDVYPVTSIGRFFASVISLVGIGIIAIPTGIIAAGFTQAIEKNEKEEPDNMSEEQLLIQQAKINKKLMELGYIGIISEKQTDTASPSVPSPDSSSAGQNKAAESDF